MSLMDEDKKEFRFLKRNALRLISIFFSICLWFYVMNSDPLEVSKKVEIKFQTPNKRAVIYASAYNVKVTYKGPRAFLKEYEKVRDEIQLDLTKLPIKSNRISNLKIKNDMISVPFGVEILSISPDVVDIKLEKRLTKKIPIAAQTVGRLPEGVKLLDSKIRPMQAQVSGPQSLIKSLKQIETIPINIEELQGTGELKTKIIELDPRLSVNKLENAIFYYDIKPHKANLTLKNIKIKFFTSASAFKTKAKLAALDVLAPEGLNIKESEVRVIANIPDDAKGNISVDLEAQLPEGVHLLKLYPDTIKIYVP